MERPEVNRVLPIRKLSPAEQRRLVADQKFLGEELIRIQSEIDTEYNSCGMWVSPDEEDLTPLGCDFNDWQEIPVDLPLT